MHRYQSVFHICLIAGKKLFPSFHIICSDKTGTLTENRMTVTMLAVAGQRVELAGVVEENQSILNGADSQSIQAIAQGTASDAIALLLMGTTLCKGASVIRYLQLAVAQIEKLLPLSA